MVCGCCLAAKERCGRSALSPPPSARSTGTGGQRAAAVTRRVDEICGRAQGAAGAWRRRRADRGCRGPLLVHGDRAPRSPPVVVCSVECAERTVAAARRAGGYDNFRFVAFFFAG